MKNMKTGGALFDFNSPLDGRIIDSIPAGEVREHARKILATIKRVNEWLLDLILDPPYEVTEFERDVILGLIWPLKTYLGVRVPPVGGSPGNQADVEALYRVRAAHYVKLHGLTTVMSDDKWRRWAAVKVVSEGGPIRHLDIFTGVGSTAKEILIAARDFKLSGSVTALDYSAEMIHYGKLIMESLWKRGLDMTRCRLEWRQGDATKLDGLKETFKSVSAMCGIGAIQYPRVLGVYEQALRVLEPDGVFLMSEMHRPRRAAPGTWPIFGKGGQFFRAAESIVWECYTLPFALGELWGWVDPTPGCEVGPFTTYTAPDGTCWGWEVLEKRYEALPWHTIPVMPYSWWVIKKVKITPEETALRKRIVSGLRPLFKYV